MALHGSELHKPVLAVFPVQPEGLPHQNGCGNNPEADTEPLIDTNHVHDYEKDEEQQQTSCKYEEVLRFQPLELNRCPNPFIDWVFCHSSYTLLYYRKKERRIVAATMRKIHAPNHDAATFDVSGSPEENLPIE